MNHEIGPNDPCPCGSGEKYKKCCLKRESRTLGESWIAALVLVGIGCVLGAVLFHAPAVLAIGLVACALILIAGLRAGRHRGSDYDEMGDGVVIGRPPRVGPPDRD